MIKKTEDFMMMSRGVFFFLVFSLGVAAQDHGERIFVGGAFQHAFEQDIEFDVAFKGNRERATLSEERGLSLTFFGYEKGPLRVTFGRSYFDDPEIKDIYYVEYKGQTMDLYELNERFSIEGHTPTVSYLGSVWFDLNDSPLVFYTGAGAGFGDLHLDYDVTLEGVFESNAQESGYDFDRVGLFLVGGGVRYAVTPWAEVDMGYRLFRFNRGTFGQGQDLHLEAHTKQQIEIGLNIFLFGRP